MVQLTGITKIFLEKWLNLNTAAKPAVDFQLLLLRESQVFHSSQDQLNESFREWKKNYGESDRKLNLKEVTTSSQFLPTPIHRGAGDAR